MRVSQHYNLHRSQPSLDFVDVMVDGDLAVFIDPRALRLLPSRWGAECVYLVQDFFKTVLQAIQAGDDALAQGLLARLKEPNETRLGLSRGRPRGRALGNESAIGVWESLTRSDAARSGLLEDLEDTILMVEGIAGDIVSDIATNLIRQPLIHYTQDACRAYGIPLEPEVPSGALWNPQAKMWFEEFVPLPTTPEGRLLLVPKVIVRRHMDYDVDQYYRHYLLPHLQAQEAGDPTSELVQVLRDGRRRVTKKAVAAKYGTGKSAIVRQTRNNPEVLERYRSDKRNRYRPPLTHEDVASETQSEPPDWDELLQVVRDIPPGAADADAFHRAIEALLSALLYPHLSMPQMEFPIHQGRKRIDITYTNVGEGFFGWVQQNYPAPHIFVECKNYSRDVANPELDQLQGRFSPSRGKVGILVCRSLENKRLFLNRCRDTAMDDRGFILALDDDDLAALIEERKAGPVGFGLLKARFDALIM